MPFLLVLWVFKYTLIGITPVYYDLVHNFCTCCDIKEIDKEYLYYFLLSSTCKDQFSITADGGVVQNLNIEKVQSSIILLPVISEQHKIVDYLNTKCSEIDSLIKSKEKLIEELTAYRKSLIFEYVTGKKEVPAV